MKKLLFIGAEAMPFAATGGLGDVMGSLPSAIKEAGGDDVDVRVVMPLYGAVSSAWREKMTKLVECEIALSWRKQYCGIYSIVKDGVTYYFIDNEYYFRRPTLYGSFDDGERFAFFCKAAIELPRAVGFYPDVIHAHDWQAALSLVYINQDYRSVPGYENTKTVFTIHNIEYQGKYDFSILNDVFDLKEETRHIVEYNGCINLMKGAIVSANTVSTVSPRYAEEIQSSEYAHGLENILKENSYKLCGILNGIDYVYYNPSDDNVIPQCYTWRSQNKKYENKTALQREVGLPERTDVPMISVISRLAAHKGLDIVSKMIYNLIYENDVQFVLLGKGEPAYERFFSELETAFPDKVRALIT